MRALIFFLGFLCAGIPSVHLLVKADPEPLGASVVLYFLFAVGAVTSPLAYGLSAEWSNRFPSNVPALFSGMFSAIVFFAAFALIPLSVGTLVAAGIAVVALISLSLALPFFSVEA